MYILVVSYGCPSQEYPSNGIFQFDQAKALAKTGHHVVFAAVDLRSLRRHRKWGVENFIKEGVEVFVLNLPLGPIPDKLLHIAGKHGFEFLYRKIEKKCGRPDIVHAHFGGTAANAVRICKKKRLPFIITEHSSGINKPLLPKNIIKRMKVLYEAADIVLVVSKVLGKNIYKKMGIETQCVYNIVDTDIFNYTTHEINESFQFVAVGSLIQRKGFDLLLDAFADLLKTYPSCFLTIYGEGPERAVLEAQSRRLGITYAVKFMGQSSRTEIFLGCQKADVFVLASRLETFGVVYIEAMASGLPVIATKCGGPEDFVTPETGLLIPTEDTAALKEAMLYIVEHHMEYDRKKISEYAKVKFSPEKIASELTGIYRRVLEPYSELENAIQEGLAHNEYRS